MKMEYNQAATQVLNVLEEPQSSSPSRPGELNAANLKKLNEDNERKAEEADMEEHTRKLFKKKPKEKPQWAITKEEREQKEE